MSSELRTYFLSPNLDFSPPPDGPIALGSIIYDPKRPERSLNRAGRVAIPPIAIYHAHKEGWKETRQKTREAQGGLWASFLQLIVGVGGDAIANRSHSLIETYTCERLETQFFQPDDDYLRESLRNPAVKMWTEKSRFDRKTLYMITGLKIARGVTAKTSKLREHGFDGSLGADGTSSGVPIAAGPEVKWASKREEDVSFTGSSDCVFAFQLLQIRSRKKDDQVSRKDYHRGALYHLEDSDVTVDDADDIRDSWGFEDIENGSIGLPGLVFEPTVDEYGARCEIVSSRDQ